MRIAIATCAEYPHLAEDDRPFLEAMNRAKIEWELQDWRNPKVEWDKYTAVLIRCTWDYVPHIQEFRSWLNALHENRIRVFNPIPVMLANLDKNYLRNFEAKGIKTLPTLWIPKGDFTKLQNLETELKEKTYVIKPAISAGAFQTHKMSRKELLADPAPLKQILQICDLLIQPFAEEITTVGEWSFIFFGNTFSHAVLKTPRASDFRVQFIHGGMHHKETPTAKLYAQVVKVESRLAQDRLYTRIDGIVRNEEFLVMEVELIEPMLFLESHPPAADLFVKALKTRLEGTHFLLEPCGF